jgi:hypothetical protein
MADQYNPVAYRGDTGNQFKPRSGFKNWLLGNPELFQQIPKYSPQTMQGLEQLFSQGLEGIQNPQAGFEPIAQQAQHRFQTQTVPGLAERFTAMGGGQRSSAFQSSLGNAGSDLERNLAALGSQYGLQNRAGLLDQLKLGLTPSFETIHRPRQSGFLQGLIPPGLGGGNYQGALGNTSDLVSLIGKILPFLL